ncbi:MAG: methyltransferase domain-containing protein [Candidatus Caldarchaeum sp.]
MRGPYEPAEDTFLLEDAVKQIPVKGLAAEVGCSTGYVLRVLVEHGFEAVGTDVDANAVEKARERLHDRYGAVHLINSLNLPFRPRCVDLVAANPPYLPNDAEFYDPSVHGGPSGVETAVEIVEESSEALKFGGYVAIVVSSLSDVDRLLTRASQLGLRFVKKAELRLFFESLICFIFRLRG